MVGHPIGGFPPLAPRPAPGSERVFSPQRHSRSKRSIGSTGCGNQLGRCCHVNLCHISLSLVEMCRIFLKWTILSSSSLRPPLDGFRRAKNPKAILAASRLDRTRARGGTGCESCARRRFNREASHEVSGAVVIPSDRVHRPGMRLSPWGLSQWL
jgi:hypothetical protein